MANTLGIDQLEIAEECRSYTSDIQNLEEFITRAVEYDSNNRVLSTLLCKLNQLNRANEEYYIEASLLLELASRSYELLEGINLNVFKELISLRPSLEKLISDDLAGLNKQTIYYRL